MAGLITNDYISATRKSFILNDNDGKMIEKNFIEIEGTFLVKIHDNAFRGMNGENVFEQINSFLEVVEPLKVRGLSHDQIRLSVVPNHSQVPQANKEEAEDDDDPDEIDNVPEIFKIKDDLFNFDTPLYNLIDVCLKEETLMHKARIKGSWGDATPGVMKFCTWLKISFENFHELDYDVLVKLEECWWKVNIDEIWPFTRWDDHLRGPYANVEPKITYDPYHNINRISEINYVMNNIGNIQEGQWHMENLTHEPSACKIRRFEMMKYSFEADEEYVAIK
ncbi:hypothetical protein Tco_0884100 [Tanacetum coccineum]